MGIYGWEEMGIILSGTSECVCVQRFRQFESYRLYNIVLLHWHYILEINEKKNEARRRSLSHIYLSKIFIRNT